MRGKAVRLFFTGLILTLSISSCWNTPTTDKEYRVTLTAEGVSAPADVAYSDLSTDPVSLIFSENGVSVPYSRETTGDVDFSDIRVHQFSVTAGINNGETLSVTVYYEEILEFPPENNRKVIAEGVYENTTGGPITEDVIVNFSLPEE
jgi:effector-binding domain-containing protein